MRGIWVAILFGVGAVAQADRLLQVPTGRKIPFQAVKSEFWFEPFTGGTSEYYLGTGVTDLIDIEYRTQRFRNENVRGAFDFSVNVVGPIPDLSPGISFGMQDTFNNTLDGRRAFVAFTLRQTLDGLDGDVYGDLTLGAYVGANSSALIGVSLPISSKFRFVFDHNGYRAAGGIEINPIKNASLRYVARADQTFVSLGWTQRF